MLGRLAGTLALLCAVAPSTAQAGTFSIQDGRYHYKAAPGEANNVHVYHAQSGALAVEDSGATMQGRPVLTDGTSVCLKVKAGFHCQNPNRDSPPPAVVLDLGDANDRVRSGVFGIDVSLGSGNDSYQGLFGTWPSSGTIDAGPGDDRLDVEFAAVRTEVHLGPGNDHVRGETWYDSHFFYGDGGDDSFDIAGPPDAWEHSTYAGLYGGEGADRVTRVTGSLRTHFYGGPGGDTSVPGLFWRYDEEGRTEGVSVTADGTADDGAPGEGDNVPDGIRFVMGTYSDDTMRLGSLPGGLAGLGGQDDLHGSPAAGDTVTGGDGDDRIHLDDGHTDTLQCGFGNDWADLDAADAPIGGHSCETVV